MMFPLLPDAHAIAVLLLIVIALYLFTRENVPLETSSLLILIALVVGFEVFPYQRDGALLHPTEFFSGFGHEALVTICALMIAGKAMETTGALNPLAAFLSRMWAASPLVSSLLTLIVAAAFSAFLNNTPIVVMLLPILIRVSLNSKRSASSILLPMGLATLLGGMATTIGTSTNLLVVSIASDLGMRRLHMFDFAQPVLIVGSVGIIYLWLIAPRLLPERQALLSDTSPRIFDALLYITKDSFANGKSLTDVIEKTGKKMRVVSIQRGEGLTVTTLPTAELREGDRLLVRDLPDNLKEFEQALGATMYNASDIEHPVSEERPLAAAEGQQLAELVVTERSPLHNTTAKAARFTERYGLLILAIHRARSSATITSGELGEVVLRAGDVVLTQGGADSLNELKASGDMLVLDATVDLPHTAKAPLALAIMAAIVVAAAAGLAPIVVTSLAGMGLMVVTRCLTWHDAANALSAPVILIVAVSLALGLALMRTGGAEYLAQLYVALVSGQPTVLVLSGLMLLMAIMTNIVSNNAAAVIGTPIAVSIAGELSLPAEAFVLAVLFGANMSFATPMAYKTNLLIFSAGGYKFSDFLRVGIPLAIIMWVGLSLLLMVSYQI